MLILFLKINKWLEEIQVINQNVIKVTQDINPIVEKVSKELKHKYQILIKHKKVL